MPQSRGGTAGRINATASANARRGVPDAPYNARRRVLLWPPQPDDSSIDVGGRPCRESRACPITTEILEQLTFAGPSATQAIVERPKQLLLQSPGAPRNVVGSRAPCVGERFAASGALRKRETVNRSHRPSSLRVTTINVQLFRGVRNTNRAKRVNRRVLVDFSVFRVLGSQICHPFRGRRSILRFRRPLSRRLRRT